MPTHAFEGLHVLGEFYEVCPKLLNDAWFLQEILEKAISKSGATLCSWQVKIFEPTGLTLVALLAESHVSVHTYPEYGALFFDAFTCGNTCDPQVIAQILMEALEVKRKTLRLVYRGSKTRDLAFPGSPESVGSHRTIQPSHQEDLPL